MLQSQHKHGSEASGKTIFAGIFLKKNLGIVGIVANLCCVDNLIEAELLGKLVSGKMSAIVLKNKEVCAKFFIFSQFQAFEKYYHKHKNSSANVQMIALTSILPYRSRREEDSTNSLLPFKPLEGAPTEGFLGFAINRIQLR
jgi:hypothetical protein